MFEMLNSVQFPSGSGIQGAVFSVLGWLYNGIGSYGVAIIIFTLLLRLVMTPLDFGTKYFTKRNAIRMKEIKPEEQALRETYADDPVGYQRAKQALYKRHGAGMGGFCLFTLLNLVIMILVFFSVFQALNGISNYNVYRQFRRLEHIHAHHIAYNAGTLGYAPPIRYIGNDQWEPIAGDNISFQEAINNEYNATRTSFIWVHNVWRPDTWASRTLSWGQFRSATNRHGDWGDLQEAELNQVRDVYNEIFDRQDGVTQTGRGWNGMLLLILLAAGSTYLSMLVNAKAMKTTKATQDNKKEAEVGYSIRKVRNTTSDGKTPERLPQIDPASATKMMKFIMPLIMVVFTMTTTAALAIYITAGAFIMTGLSFGINFLVELLIKHQEKRKKDKIGVDGDVITINPHAKYFKRKTGKQ